MLCTLLNLTGLFAQGFTAAQNPDLPTTSGSAAGGDTGATWTRRRDPAAWAPTRSRDGRAESIGPPPRGEPVQMSVR